MYSPATRGNDRTIAAHDESRSTLVASAVQVRQPSPDALVSFSDFLLDRFGLVASMQVALIASIGIHSLVLVGVGFTLIKDMGADEPHNVMDVVLVNSKSASRPTKADALAQANLLIARAEEEVTDRSALLILDQQMRDAARELASTQPGASNKLRSALSGMDENNLGTRMQRSSDWLRSGQFSDPAEAALTSDLQKLGLSLWRGI